MKHACSCSTFHFNSLTLFADMVLSSADRHMFLKSVCFVCLFLFFFFSKRSFGNISGVSSSLNPDHARRFVGPDLGPNCLQRLSADYTSK